MAKHILRHPKTAVAGFERRIYLFSFCEGLIFWYAIEKLFMQSIGISIGAIVIIGLIAQAGKMIFDIPSAVIADRWHRRNTLILASIIMVIASITLPFADNAIEYALLSLVWTLYAAFKSGTDVAFIFDSLKTHGGERSFQRVLYYSVRGCMRFTL